MMKKKKDEACCLTSETFTSRCRMESLISIDERGQMVLPKELRDRAKIGTGDKLALISWEKDGQLCCFTLVKADFLADKVKDFLEPIMMTRWKEKSEADMEEKDIKSVVREKYGNIAATSGSCCRSVSCCSGPAVVTEIGKKIGYDEADLSAAPEGANLGLGCGNPIALASLKEGETVLDLGSGAGFDCFLAAGRVGPKGRVIGVDMTPEMIERARENARKDGVENVEFRLGDIEHLPVEDGSADVIISNCVINLAPDKGRVFQEAFRVLKPGGRLMVSDIVLTRPLPDFVKNSVAAYIGCVAGAALKEDYLGAMKQAGFEDVTVQSEAPFPVDCVTTDPMLAALAESLNLSMEELARRATETVLSVRVSGIKRRAWTMIKGKQLQTYTDFYNSARYNETLDPKTTLLIHLASAMAMACYPWMEHYLGVAGEMGISDEEVAAAQAIVMAVSGGRVRAQFREVRRRAKVKNLQEDSCKQQGTCWRQKGAAVMTPDEMREKALQMFEKGYHWSQAVLAVGQEKLGRGNEELIRAVGAYGGGLGAGEVCGAVFGALAVFGLQFSRGKDEEKENPRMWALVREFLKRFREEIGQGKIYCRDIAGVDWSDVNALKAFYKSEKLLACRDLTGATARLLGEFMESEPFLKQQRK